MDQELGSGNYELGATEIAFFRVCFGAKNSTLAKTTPSAIASASATARKKFMTNLAIFLVKKFLVDFFSKIRGCAERFEIHRNKFPWKQVGFEESSS